MPFDINERDATGQNILYVSSLLGNKELVDVILKFRVNATRLSQSDVSMNWFFYDYVFNKELVVFLLFT